MFRFWHVFTIVVLLIALSLGSFVVVGIGSREAGFAMSYTCVLCRLGRVDKTVFGSTRSTFYENECSRWYPKNVEPSHAHIWE